MRRVGGRPTSIHSKRTAGPERLAAVTAAAGRFTVLTPPPGAGAPQRSVPLGRGRRVGAEPVGAHVPEHTPLGGLS